jgi:signal transduction histidine kinase
MSAESIERALDIFTHPDDNPFHSQNGIGLGLPLTRRIVEMHGGHFNVESVLDQGTIVTMQFPEYRRHTN